MRMFKRELGTTMHQLVMQERVAYVKDRLVYSADSLAEISYDAGIASQSHMSTCYAKNMGISPGRHRQRLRS